MTSRVTDMSQLIIYAKDGRKSYEWNPEHPKSVNKARKIFEKRLIEGYAAFEIFRVNSQETSLNENSRELSTQLVRQTVVSGEQIHEFDSRAGTIHMTPPMVGG